MDLAEIKRIALLGVGDMGGGIARTLVDGGFDVVTDLTGRGAETRGRAEQAGVTDAGSLQAALSGADIVLSVMPPGKALAAAEEAAGLIAGMDAKPLYADLNAISPKTVEKIAAAMTAAGAGVLDGGIIGLSPDKGCPRVYLSGPDAVRVADALRRPDMKTIPLGEAIGQASTMKMLYAGMNKGYWAMLAAISVTATKNGLMQALLDELEENNPFHFKTMESWVGFLAADAHRFGPEMDEIAETMEAAGVTPKFHEGARWVYDLLDETPLREETRATWDRSRPVTRSAEIYLEALKKRR